MKGEENPFRNKVLFSFSFSFSFSFLFFLLIASLSRFVTSQIGYDYVKMET